MAPMCTVLYNNGGTISVGSIMVDAMFAGWSDYNAKPWIRTHRHVCSVPSSDFSDCVLDCTALDKELELH